MDIGALVGAIISIIIATTVVASILWREMEEVG